MQAERIVSAFVVVGALGWLMENVLYGPRYSKAFHPAPMPLLPVYGTGGVLIAAVAPHLAKRSWPERAVVYGGMLTALELGACKLDRALGPPSWDYDGECIDARHMFAWAALGLAAETIVRERGR